ncbi:MAG: SH3 domain-containing protein, partial [Lysinibacillus sp.]
MQKILIILVSFTLLFSFASFQAVPNNVLANSQTVTVNGEIVNVRQGPGLTYEVVRTLHRGDTLTVLASEGDWLKVQDGRMEGWIANWLVTSSEKQNSTGEQYVISQVDHLNIRQQPSVSSAVIAQLFTGNEANFIKQDGDWIQIQYGATTGWVAKAYVTIATKSKEQAEATNDQQAQYFTISVDAVNVRAEGNLHSKKIGIAYRGSKYKVLQTTDNWVQIQYENNMKAWIYSFYGNLNGQVTSPSSDVNSDKGTVTIIYNGTNLRQEASTASAVVQRVNAGQAFEIVGSEGDFYKIKTNGGHAYVANWVVSINGQTGQAPQASTETVHKPNRQAGT